MRTITFTTLTLLFTLLLSACGGGGSTSAGQNPTAQGNNNDTNNTNTIPTTAQGKGIAVCSGAEDGFQNATVLEAGKVIKGLENNPSIRLWHLSDGTRKACVKSGKVEVL